VNQSGVNRLTENKNKCKERIKRMINMLNQSTRLPRLTNTKGFILASLIAGATALPFLMPVQKAQAVSKAGSHKFQFTIYSTNTAHFCGPTLLCIDAVGMDKIGLSSLGHFTAVYRGPLDFSTIDPNTGCGPNPGTLFLTSTDGNYGLEFALSGEHCASAPGAPLGVTSGTFTFFGSLGRFEGVHGSGTFQDTQTSSNPDFSGTDTAYFQGVFTTP
jgi:hypothetical protein